VRKVRIPAQWEPHLTPALRSKTSLGSPALAAEAKISQLFAPA